MAGSTALLLALTPLLQEGSPTAMGLGSEQLLQTETHCAVFCLKALNSQYDVKMSGHASLAESPQPMPKGSENLSVSTARFNSYEASWHPFYDAAVTVGFRTSERMTQRNVSGKLVKSVSAESREIPLGISLKPGSQIALAAGYSLKKISLTQENLNTATRQSQTMSAYPNQWSLDAVWQKDEQTGLGISYKAPARSTLEFASGESKGGASVLSFVNPQWSEPQEFTLSLARFTAFEPPPGIVVGPFDNIFHGSLSVVSWDSGKPVSYSALASQSASKDGWNLTGGIASAADTFVFNTLDPNISLSAGLESLWYRGAMGSISSMTHIRVNHIATQAEQNQLQGGFGFAISTKHVGLQAASLWRNSQTGFAMGLSSFL